MASNPSRFHNPQSPEVTRRTKKIAGLDAYGPNPSSAGQLPKSLSPSTRWSLGIHYALPARAAVATSVASVRQVTFDADGAGARLQTPIA
jgi:hypothetical protein